MVSEQHYRWGRAYRDGRLVCSRVHVRIVSDVRIAPSPPTTQRLQVRFLEGVDKALQAELHQLVRSRGLRRKRLAERSDPIKIVWEEPPGLRSAGRLSCEGRLEPEVRHAATLDEIEFRLHPIDHQTAG